MCGIAGVVDLAGRPIDAALLLAITNTIRHRGPDDEGYVLIDRASGEARSYSGPDSPAEIRGRHPVFQPSDIAHRASIGLAHRRFSIIDLSPGGHQPFFASDGSCCVVFNGEIYNYVELKAELEAEGVTFHTTCDTEVLVEAYRLWGTECFSKFNGFWAIALYDFKRRQLILSRDRLGKRPLYHCRVNDRIWFASEIKSLLRVPEIAERRAVNPEAVWHWCVDGMRDLEGTTFFKGINNLPAASWAVVDQEFPARVSHYWRLPQERLREADISVNEAVTQVRDTLSDAVRIRMRADVPIAFELSGGLDSSTILALAAQNRPGRLRTYTVRFADPRWNEEPFARSVAQRFDVDYRVIDPALDNFWQGIGPFTELQEEPYHSPNLQVSQVIWSLMRVEGTKVTLTGSAGDEMFGGYAKYFWRAQAENVRNGDISQAVDNVMHWTEQLHSVGGVARELTQAFGIRRLARRTKRLFGPLASDYLTDIEFPARRYYAGTFSKWQNEEITNTLIPYWLMSGDKSLLGVPFEGRCPILDYRVVELATRLPVTYLIRHGWHKWILRKAMEDLLPPEVVWRRTKMGFPYPYESFYAKYRPVIDLILDSARNPYIDKSKKSLLRTDWRGISFILWYEFFINDNRALFRKVESMVQGPQAVDAPSYIPEFLNGVVLSK